jgi:hypothetical protein
MVKKSGEVGDITLGTDAWNVADGFTKLKILRQLLQLDKWETIAQFGTEEVDEDLNYDAYQIKKRRVEALERFISTTRQLIGNVLFALKKEDQIKVESYLDRLKELQRHIPQLYTQSMADNINDRKFDINEKLFETIFLILQEIKDGLNVPLNKAGLIFRPTEEVDLDKIMQDIVQGG